MGPFTLLCMADPGWYPDPSGASEDLRYFDGTHWTGELMAASAQSGGTDGNGGGNGSRAGLLAAIVAVVVISLLVWFFVRPGGGTSPGFPEDTNSASPSITGWDETSEPSAPPTPTNEPTDTGGAPAACPDDTYNRAPNQPDNGRYTGGGLSFAEIPGWSNSRGWGLDWASDRAGQRNEVTGSWVSIAVVGEIDREVFPSAQAATNQLMQCMASSYYYQDFSGRKDLQNEAVTIDGKSGWKLVAEVTVSNRPDGVRGDVITIIVLDVGREGKLAVFCGEAPIGDAERNQIINDASAGLQVHP